MSNLQGLLAEDLTVVIAAVIDVVLDESQKLEPDWRPLQASLPADECAGFMWMDRIELLGDRIEVYRHGITRRWLHIGHSGHFYQYVRGEYVDVDPSQAVRLAFEKLSTFGANRTTSFDSRYLASRISRLRTHGIQMVI